MKDKKILLVDDETEFVSTLAERLKLRGFNVETATDGEAAIQMTEESRPVLIILDLKMPGLGGLEVLKQVKGGDSSIKVILLTGHGSTKEGIEGMNLGASDYLMKPINIEELIAKMQDAIDNG